MAQSPRIYTRTGDDGTTGLGDGSRASKADPRVAAYGTVDELNAMLGVVLAANPAAELVAPLARVQKELFTLGAELSNPMSDAQGASGPRVAESHVSVLESDIDKLGAGLPPLRKFILPGGDAAAAGLHAARAVCRRAERLLVELQQEAAVRPLPIAYLNRLGDALFVMARFQNKSRGVADICWDGRS